MNQNKKGNMKKLTVFLLALAGCATEISGDDGYQSTAGSPAEFALTAATCSDDTLQAGSRTWFRAQYPAITSCSGAATDAVWNCTGQGGQAWKVTRTYNNPGVQVKRKVERSQASTKNYSCASAAHGACGYSCGWY